jgi:RNA polymerase sigma factor (sigma-70 family)
MYFIGTSFLVGRPGSGIGFPTNGGVGFRPGSRGILAARVNDAGPRERQSDQSMTTDERTPTFDDAFTSLFRHAFVVAVRILGDRGDAEDVAIEAVARAHLHWRRIGSSPYPWLTRVSANLAIDELRRRRRRPPTSAVTSAEAAAPELGRDERLDLQRILETLPRRQRDVLVLHYFDDLTHDAIAATLQTTAGTVKQHQSRGLGALRRALGATREKDDDDG